MTYGYTRVSTQGQNLDRQIDLLVKAKVKPENIYQEKMTGTKRNRPQLNAMLDILKEGDIVVVESLSRLGRSSADLIHLLNVFAEKGVVLKSLKESINMGDASGKMLAHILAILSEFERDIIVERVKEGVAAARKRGRVGGRPKIKQKVLEKALALYDEGSLSVRDICSCCSISRSSFYAALNARKAKMELEDTFKE